MNPLAVIPTYLSQPDDLVVFETCVRTLRETEPDLEVLVVDDGSPAAQLLNDYVTESNDPLVDFVFKPENEGFSKTVNVGLARARDEGRHAVLVNADIEFVDKGWLERMVAQERSDGAGPAWVVGALLIFPNGLIQHAGDYFSNLHRTWAHRYQYAPHNLPEAQFAWRGAVTGALQLIRHEALTEVGLYDEGFELSMEDVDYCIRVFQAGQECVMQPKVRAVHRESFFRGRKSDLVAARTRRSWIYFCTKHATTNFAEWVPSL